MNKQSHSPLRIDHPQVMLARYHQWEWEREVERHQLRALARAARPRPRPLRTVLLQWLLARRPASRRAGQPITGSARGIGT